jgi:hypothetical protein
MPGGLFPPIEVIGSWDINYVNFPTSGTDVIIITAVLTGITYLVVGMRLWARFRLANNGGVDDVLIIFNMVLGLSIATRDMRLLVLTSSL